LVGALVAVSRRACGGLAGCGLAGLRRFRGGLAAGLRAAGSRAGSAGFAERKEGPWPGNSYFCANSYF